MFTKTMKFSLAVLAIFSISAEEIQTVEITPGLWSHSNVLSVEGKGVVHEQSDQHCITEAQANPSVQSLLADILEGDCDLTNFVHTIGSANLNLTCRDHDSQAVSVGEINISYTKTAYTVIGNVVITGPGGVSKVKGVTQANRVGECS